jgi:hypothetical protein
MEVGWYPRVFKKQSGGRGKGEILTKGTYPSLNPRKEPFPYRIYSPLRAYSKGLKIDGSSFFYSTGNSTNEE